MCLRIQSSQSDDETYRVVVRIAEDHRLLQGHEAHTRGDSPVLRPSVGHRHAGRHYDVGPQLLHIADDGVVIGRVSDLVVYEEVACFPDRFLPTGRRHVGFDSRRCEEVRQLVVLTRQDGYPFL